MAPLSPVKPVAPAPPGQSRLGPHSYFAIRKLAARLIFVYVYPMRILWDEPKRLANLDKHGLDFVDLTLDFFEHALILPTHDRRLVAVGKLAGRTVTVIFAPLGSEALSLVSMRPASRTERSFLDEH